MTPEAEERWVRAIGVDPLLAEMVAYDNAAEAVGVLFDDEDVWRRFGEAAGHVGVES